MTTFLEFFSEGYCSEKTSEELAIELGQAVLAGDVVFGNQELDTAPPSSCFFSFVRRTW